MIYVMSDIHGNRRRFDSIMDQIQLQPEDKLYVIGDVIDRHPDGISILLQLMEMPNVTVLLGNHEFMMLNAIDYFGRIDKFERGYNLRLWQRNGAAPTIEAYQALDENTKESVIRYLMSLPITKTVVAGHTRYKLVHAAPPELYDPRKAYYVSATEFSVWERLSFDAALPKGYTYIIGHTPTDHFAEQEKRRKLYQQDIWDMPEETPDYLSVWYGDHRICIDCGSGFPDTFQPEYGGMGRLACLRLDDRKVFYSEEDFDPKAYRSKAKKRGLHRNEN